jgi:hypothetical protein
VAGAGKCDGHVVESSKEDPDGVPVFVRPNLLFLLFITMTSSKTGLFSVIVGAFIIEFYKKLSPDSGDQIVALLCQISQQLSNFVNGSYSTPPISESFLPVHP